MSAALRVADVIRSCWESVNRAQALPPQVVKAVRHLLACRTAALGGHLYRCDQCGNEVPLYNSCQDRHCPTCQTSAKEKWLSRRRRELLPVPYFHSVFTLPHALNGLVKANRRLLLGELFTTVTPGGTAPTETRRSSTACRPRRSPAASSATSCPRAFRRSATSAGCRPPNARPPCRPSVPHSRCRPRSRNPNGPWPRASFSAPASTSRCVRTAARDTWSTPASSSCQNESLPDHARHHPHAPIPRQAAPATPPVCSFTGGQAPIARSRGDPNPHPPSNAAPNGPIALIHDSARPSRATPNGP